MEEVAAFEEEFAEWNESRHAISFVQGRVALSAAIQALGLRALDEVIVPGYTCVVVANAFAFEGIRIVFADIELDTFGLSIESVKKRITPATRGIVIQHLHGFVCRDYERILEFARDRNLVVIEDCAHSAGARFKGRRIGNEADVAFYSSQQAKAFSTVAGGLATTNSGRTAQRLRDFQARCPFPSDDYVRDVLRTTIIDYYSKVHAQRWILGSAVYVLLGASKIQAISRDELSGVKPKGYRRRMPAPVAAIGRLQLQKLDSANAERRRTADFWMNLCTEHGFRPVTVVPDSEPAPVSFPVLVAAKEKERLEAITGDLGVSPYVWFRSHLHPSKQAVAGCPNADIAVQSCIHLPCLLVKRPGETGSP
jgi:dTDP-4-amino-4,6-dideoxygalactose transaminase